MSDDRVVMDHKQAPTVFNSWRGLLFKMKEKKYNCCKHRNYRLLVFNRFFLESCHNSNNNSSVNKVFFGHPGHLYNRDNWQSTCSVTDTFEWLRIRHCICPPPCIREDLSFVNPGGWHESCLVLQTAGTFTLKDKHDVSHSAPFASKGQNADKLIATITYQ